MIRSTPTTVRQQDDFSRESLSSLDHIFAYYEYLAYISKWDVKKMGRMRYLESRIPHPLFNYVYGHPSLMSAQDMEKFKVIFGSIPYTWIISSKKSKILQPFIQAFHLEKTITNKCVHFDLNDQLMMPSLREVTDLKLVHVQNHSEMTTFDRISSVCFHHEPGMQQEFMRGYIHSGFKNSTMKLYLFVYQGEPVGITSTFSLDGTLGLYGGSILPQARYQGIASAMLVQFIDRAKKEGYEKLACQLLPVAMPFVSRFSPREDDTVETYTLSKIFMR